MACPLGGRLKSKQYWNPMVPELAVTNFDKSLEFYTNVLGFKVIHSRQNPDFAYLDQENAQLMIEQWGEDGWNTGGMQYPLGRGINFQIEMRDISPVYDRLIGQTYPLFRDVEENWYQSDGVEIGQKEFLVQDPDGYLLRFCENIGER